MPETLVAGASLRARDLSGIETNLPPYAWVYTLRDGRVVKGCFYPDHGAALEAVGLSE